MSDIRIVVQTKILEVLSTGTYFPVTYAASIKEGIDVKVPTVGTTPVKPSQILCNETSAGLSDVSKFNSRGKGYSLRNWRFECNMSFAVEVSLSYFFTNEAKELTFEADGFLVSVSLADYTVEHPVQQGAHTGTKTTVGFTVNSRR